MMDCRLCALIICQFMISLLLFFNKMLTNSEIRLHLNFFFWFGLSSYDPNECLKTTDLGFSLRKRLSSFGYLIVAAISGLMSLQEVSMRHKTSFDNCIYVIFVIFNVMTATMVFKHSSPGAQQNWKRIWKSFGDLEKLNSDRLQIKIVLKTFNCHYVFNICLMIFVFGALTTSQLIHAQNLIRVIGGIVLQTLALLAIFQILFYVSFFNFILFSINHFVERIPFANNINSDQFNNDIQFIKNMERETLFYFETLKLIHFKLWEIIQLINDNFGGILSLLLISKSNTAIQSCYRIVVRLCEDNLSTNLMIIGNICFWVICDLLVQFFGVIFCFME